MKAGIVLGIALLASAGLAVWQFLPSAEAAATTVVQPNVTVSAASEDGAEIFVVRIFEPWVGAGRRVVTAESASIADSGMVNLGFRRFCDAGVPAEPMTITGTRFQCIVTTGMSEWSSVAERGDITLTVVAAD
jgi:hypothetical protein